MAEGKVLGHESSGRVVLAAGGLPGEVVRVQVERARPTLLEGAVVAVESASPLRVVPPCPHVAAGCGGCDLQHLAVASQVSLKVDVVADALRRLGRIDDPPVHAGAVVDAVGHRTTLRLGVDGDGRPGFRRRASHEVEVVDDCLVAHPRLVELLGARFVGADEVVLRTSVATGARLAVVDPGADGCTGLPADVVVVGRDQLDAGAPVAITEVVRGQRLRVSADSFFQSGPAAAALLADAVAAAGGSDLAAASTVVDAYGGVGLLSAVLGADGAVAAGAHWVVVERSSSSAADARVNLAGRAASVVEVAVEAWDPVAADVVVADPARAGLGAEAAAVLAGSGAGVVVLVSCDAAALGRDASLLAEHGFRLDRAEVLDLFPHTHHVEVVSRFER